MWDEITYPFPNFNGCTVEVWEWIGNFIPHFIMGVITYPFWDSSQSMLVKGATVPKLCCLAFWGCCHWSPVDNHDQSMPNVLLLNFSDRTAAGISATSTEDARVCFHLSFNVRCWVTVGGFGTHSRTALGKGRVTSHPKKYKWKENFHQ